MAALRGARAGLPPASSGLRRQDALTDLFIRAAELGQGLTDDAFARWGEDRDDGVVPLGHALVHALARLAQAYATRLAHVLEAVAGHPPAV